MTSIFWAAVPASASTDKDVFLHQAGMSLNNTAPGAGNAATKDSAGLNFSGGNAWRDIGTWTAAPSLSNGSLVQLSDLHVWLGLKKRASSSRRRRSASATSSRPSGRTTAKSEAMRSGREP